MLHGVGCDVSIKIMNINNINNIFKDLSFLCLGPGNPVNDCGAVVVARRHLLTLVEGKMRTISYPDVVMSSFNYFVLNLSPCSKSLLCYVYI